MDARADPSSLVVKASGAEISLASDDVLRGKVVSKIFKGGQLQQSGPALAGVIPEAITLVRGALTASPVGSLPDISVPRSLVEVNDVLKAVLSNDPAPGRDYTLSWDARVDGIVFAGYGEAGACSTIPTYIQYFALVTYNFQLKLKDDAKPTLQVSVTDPNGVLAHTRCWTNSARGILERHDISNTSLSAAFAQNAAALSSMLVEWVKKNRSELLDDVGTAMSLSKSADGVWELDGREKSWQSDPTNTPSIAWRLVASPSLKAWAP